MAQSGIRREIEVAFSTETQPMWFRVLKWAIFLGVTRRLQHTRWRTVWLVGAPLSGIMMHLIYRSKTQGWTRSWGGWKADHATE